MKKLCVLALILLMAAPIMAQPKDVPLKDGWMLGLATNMPVAVAVENGKGVDVIPFVGIGVGAKIYLNAKDSGQEVVAVQAPLLMLTPRANADIEGYPVYNLAIGGEVRILATFGIGVAWSFGYGDTAGELIGLISVNPAIFVPGK